MARKANNVHPQTEKSARNVQLSPRGQRWPKFISQPIEPAFSKYRIRHVEPDIHIRILFPQKNTFWISVCGWKLTIRPDINPANRIVIISVIQVQRWLDSLFQIPTPLLFQNFWIRGRCQAKFLSSAKFPTCYRLSVILLLRIKKLCLAMAFLMCVV